MARLMLERLLRSFITVFFVVTFAFTVLRLSGDPALSIMELDATPEDVEAFRNAWGLNLPVHEQFFRYLKSVFSGDLGKSMLDGRAAIDIVVERIPATLAITMPALLLSILAGVPAGMLAALNRDTLWDRFIMSLSVVGLTIPSFILGLMLVFIFAVTLGWLPSGGATSWRHAIMPIITLSAGGAGVLARFTRSAMIEVIGQDYIRGASAKGMPWRRVIVEHAFPNAILPTLTVIGLMVGHLIAGAIVVESVFSWPGIGRLLVVSVTRRDLAVVQCVLFFVSFAMVFANMIIDILYGVVDPRMREQASTSTGQS